jgi:GTPase
MAKRRRRRLKPSSPVAAGHGVSAPVVAIVGRPNVGKSCLFNRLIGKKVSIVEPTAGVTRDRISALVSLPGDVFVELVDTGGLGGTADVFATDVDRQIDIALAHADMVLFVVDARDGLTAPDRNIARRLGRLGLPLLLCANKCETQDLEEAALEFWELGMGQPTVISATQGFGREELLERLVALMPPELVQAPPEPDEGPREMRVTVVGRRNVGKSSYLNALFGSERVIVSEAPGTTRDTVDVRVQLGDIAFTYIDTAGLRRRGRVDDGIELLAQLRAREAVARSDVTLLFLESVQRISMVDKHLAQLIREENKGCVVVVTKWDLAGAGMDLQDYADYLHKVLPSLSYCPVVLLSSLSGQNIQGPIRAAQSLYEQSLDRAKTWLVNKAVGGAYELRRPRVRRGVLPRIYFATQIRTNPVSIVLFCNKPAYFDSSYRRYLAGQLRKRLPFPEVPIKLIFRERVNIFERGIHSRIRRLKAIGDDRWLDASGREEEPQDGVENIDEVFTSLFGERPQHARESLEELLEVADQQPELFTQADDAPLPPMTGDAEHFDPERDAPELTDDPEASAHPLAP